jgi:hypothetical protein
LVTFDLLESARCTIFQAQKNSESNLNLNLLERQEAITPQMGWKGQGCLLCKFNQKFDLRTHYT